MFSPEKVIKIFSDNGAEIISNKDVFISNFKTTKGIILDWDGVFTDGIKGKSEQSIGKGRVASRAVKGMRRQGADETRLVDGPV